jgi:peptide/nickel transport system ATP-binding protein
MTADPFVAVEGLSIDITTARGTIHAVRDVSFTVERGRTLCIVGESGSGKSITSLGLMGLLPSTATRHAARLKLGDTDLMALGLRAMADLRGNRMAMIFQEPMTSLNPSLTIGEQMAEMLTRHRGASRKQALEKAIFWLDKVGIPAPATRIDQFPHQLSGGLRQRVMIAMMLMCEPEFIIADEPTTALDVSIQAQILHLLSSLQRELGMTMIFITHDLGVVSRIADNVAVMYGGQLVETAPTADLFANPQHPYTRGLIDCIPIPGKTKPGAHLGSIPGSIPSLMGALEGCAFAPRCTYASNECRTGKLALTHSTANLSVRCLHPLGAEPTPAAKMEESE